MGIRFGGTEVEDFVVWDELPSVRAGDIVECQNSTFHGAQYFIYTDENSLVEIGDGVMWRQPSGETCYRWRIVDMYVSKVTPR